MKSLVRLSLYMEYLELPAKSKEINMHAYDNFIEWQTSGNKQSFANKLCNYYNIMITHCRFIAMIKLR